MNEYEHDHEAYRRLTDSQRVFYWKQYYSIQAAIEVVKLHGNDYQKTKEYLRNRGLA